MPQIFLSFIARATTFAIKLCGYASERRAMHMAGLVEVLFGGLVAG